LRLGVTGTVSRRATPPNPDYATIQGQVIDAQTGLPLSGVAVSLSGGASGALTTPSDGVFSFRNLGPGSYSLQLALINYATLSVSTVAGVGQRVDLGAFALAKSQGAATGTIRGTVTDAATGAPTLVGGLDTSRISGVVLPAIIRKDIMHCSGRTIATGGIS
jgi:hypothetical protein